MTSARMVTTIDTQLMAVVIARCCKATPALHGRLRQQSLLSQLARLRCIAWNGPVDSLMKCTVHQLWASFGSRWGARPDDSCMKFSRRPTLLYAVIVENPRVHAVLQCMCVRWILQ